MNHRTDSPVDTAPITGIGVGSLPGRKRPALWVERGVRVEPLAYFRDRTAMETFLSLQVVARLPEGGAA